MPDISLRFGKDMLVIASPAAGALARRGVGDAKDADLALLLEPETVEDALSLEAAAGPQCLVAPTADFTPAGLTRAGLEDKAEALVKGALGVMRRFHPQHLLVEIAPCGLPLDPWDKGSLRENRDQYARMARLFADRDFDAFLLSGFQTITDMKCALMGIRKVCETPVFASAAVDAGGMLADGTTLEAAVRVMSEYGANVIGIETAVGPDEAAALAARIAAVTRAEADGGEAKPVMVTLVVAQRDLRQNGPTEANPYYCADTMAEAADALRTAGVQFLRAAGDVTPAYTGVLVASTLGLDVVGAGEDAESALPESEDLEAFIAAAQARVSAALEGASDLEALGDLTDGAADEPFDPSILDGPAPEAVKVSGLFPFGRPDAQ